MALVAAFFVNRITTHNHPMADSDIPARIELMRLKILVNMLAMTLASQGSQIAILINNNSRVAIQENLTSLSLADLSWAQVLLLKNDENNDFGIFFPATTIMPVNGTTYVQDSVGTLFQLFE
jgi:hypothetical protein